jgi:hypothetical protein
MRAPANTSFDPATDGTAKSGKAHRDLTKERRDHVLPVIFHAACVATTRAGEPPGGVLPDLRGDDFLLQPRQQPLRFSQGQPQIGDVTEIIGAIDLHDVHSLPLGFGADLH